MKHTYLSVLVGLALFAPAGALAQTDGEEPTDTPAEEDGSGDASAGEEGGDAATEEGGDAATEEGGDAAPEEQVSEPAPEPEPEPEVSATATTTEASEAAELGEPTMADDLADAEAEVETEATEAEEAEEEGEKLAWRNSLFLWDHAMSTGTLSRSSGLTYNPTYYQSFSVRPRWYLNDDVSLRGRLDLSYELTDTDSRALNHELVLADMRFEIVHASLYEVEGIKVGASGRLWIPTSKASRAYDMYIRPGVLVSASRPFEDVMEGLTLGANTSWAYRIGGSNVVLTDDPLPQTHATPGLDQAGDSQVGGASRVGHDVTLGLEASLSPIENMSIDATFTWWWQQGLGLADACVAVDTSPTGETCIEDGSDTHMRLATWFTLGVGYDVLEWLNASLTYGHLTGEFNPSGSRRNPFWSIDSELSLTATVTLDSLYTEFTEEDVAAADADSEATTAAAVRTRRAW